MSEFPEVTDPVLDLNRRLNIGCGRDTKEGWINLDMMPGPGVDIVATLGVDTIPLPDNSIDQIYASHVLEHIPNALAAMEELWRVAKNGAMIVIKVPYGSNDVAWEDPTHVRPYFKGSFYYFSQLAYHRAHYGYWGDWDTEKIILELNADRFDVNQPLITDQVLRIVDTERNAVKEMTAILKAVKPRRGSSPDPYNYKLMLTLG